MRGRCQSVLGEVGENGPHSRAHNLVCSRFCPDLSRAQPPGVGREGPLGAHRVQLANFKFTGKWREWTLPKSHTTQSLTSPESFQISTTMPRQLTPQQGANSAEWGDRES